MPLAYGFDVTSGRFTLRYSTTLASGVKASRSAITIIHVPVLHYPDGYAVRVQGGRVVSAANSRSLEIVADETAAQVTVTVTLPTLQQARL